MTQNDMLSDIKSMSFSQLNELADEFRTEIIENVSKTGGHLASNLGVVELTLAIHRVFDSPKDKIVWDVGHQAYVHKMLTGRRDQMGSIRSHGGLSGFPKRAESVHDMYDSGHSGTSISAVSGYAFARDLKGEDYSCVAVIGDGSLTGGVAYEALSAAGSSKTSMVVILNDNAMSISKNVGGMSRHLQHLRMTKSYLNIKAGLKSAAGSNSRLYSGLKRLRDRIKYMFLPGVIFEELGFKYYGPVDGHNIEELCETLTAAKEMDRPVLVHVVTKKGKGFSPAEENPSKYHGVGKFDPKTADAKPAVNPASWSENFGSLLIKEAEKDPSIVAVTAAMSDGTGLSTFKEAFPGRLYDAGIAEQHAVSFAAGLALNGMKPVVAIYSTFMQRAYDQIITEVCLMNLPVIFAVDRAGVTGGDGETHQGQFDIEFLNSMPNMTVLSPRDSKQLELMLNYALKLGSPCAIRYPRGNAPVFDELCVYIPKPDEYKPEPEMLRFGDDALIISDGSMLKTCFEVTQILKQKGIEVAVCDIKSIKPLSKTFMDFAFSNWKNIVTVEDGSSYNGFGAVISAMTNNNRTLNIGWPDRFIEHGTVDELRKIYGMDAQSIAAKLEEFLEDQTGRTSD